MITLAKRAHSTMWFLLLAAVAILLSLLQRPVDPVVSASGVIQTIAVLPNRIKSELISAMPNTYLNGWYDLAASQDSMSSADINLMARGHSVRDLLQVDRVFTSEHLATWRQYYDEAPANDTDSSWNSIARFLSTLRTNLEDIRELYYGSGLGYDATIDELRATARTEIHLPVVDVTLNVLPATAAISAACCVAYIYLMAILLTMRKGSTHPSDQYEWIFLYPSKVALGVAVVWLFAPVVGLCALDFYRIVPWYYGLVIVFLTAALATMDLVIVMNLRKASIS